MHHTWRGCAGRELPTGQRPPEEHGGFAGAFTERYQPISLGAWKRPRQPSMSGERAQTLPLAAAAAAGAGLLWLSQQLIKRLQWGQGGGASPPAAAAAAEPQLRARGPPHPGWQPPQKQPAPFEGGAMHTVDPSTTPSDVLYPLMISAVVPRPIGAPAWRPPGGRRLARLCSRPECTFHAAALLPPAGPPRASQPLCPRRAPRAWATWPPSPTSTSWRTRRPTSPSALPPAACAPTAARTRC